MLKTDEAIEDLQYNGLKIIQHRSSFRFGTDAVLLANFARARSRERVIDLGTGTGIISVLMAGKTTAKEIVGVEIQPEMADMARRSVELNGLEDRVKIVCGDFREISAWGNDSFNVVVSNPPYRKIGSGMVNDNSSHALSRHEVNCTLSELIATARKLLMANGRFYLVHQAERLADIMYELRSNNLEPKQMCMVQPSPGKPPVLVLIEAVKGAKSHIKWLPPAVISELPY